MAKKFRLKWQRYFEHYDVKGEYCDMSPGMSYGKLTFHQFLDFKKYKKFSKKSLFGPFSWKTGTVNHTLKFKDKESKYNYDLVFSKIFKAYQDYDKVMEDMILRRIQYVPLVDLYYAIGFFYRVDCYISLSKNWDEFITDSFLEFYNTWHHKFDESYGASYFTFFDKKMPPIFYSNYIKHRDADSEDLQQLGYRFSWVMNEIPETNSSSYSNYVRMYEDPFNSYLTYSEHRIAERLYQYQAVSQPTLTMY